MIQAKIDPKYEVLKKLREGGMGAIFLVRHRLLDELRVIKVLRSQVAEDADLRERFQREARAAIQLRHPNIAQLYDFSIDEDGTAYIILEYIDGITLEEFGRQPEARDLRLTLAIAQQALRALGYLHRKGFIHRDIAPDNLMLTRDVDGNPLVKLIDLGIVKALRGDGHKTATSVYLGKPKYSSPEQLSRPDIDARSDLYSFGVMLYELATGVYPIQGHDLPSLIAGHLNREPLSFEISDPHARIPQRLRALLLSALAKVPDQRPSSAEDFAAQLAELQADLEKEAGAAPKTLAERARQGARRAREQQLEEFARAVQEQVERRNFSEARAVLVEAFEHLGHDTHLAELQQELDRKERAERDAIARSARLEELADRAEEALAAGNLAEALSKVFEIVAHDPRHTRALALERRIEALKRERDAKLAAEPTQATAKVERTAGGTPLGAATVPELLPVGGEVKTTRPLEGFPGKQSRSWLALVGATALLGLGALGFWISRQASTPPNPSLSHEAHGSGSPSSAYEQALADLAEGKFEEAARWARLALQEDAAERDGYYPRTLYGLALARLGRCDEAETLFRTAEEAKVATLDPLWSEVVAARGRCRSATAGEELGLKFGSKLEEVEGHFKRLYEQLAHLRQLRTGPAVAELWNGDPELRGRTQRVQDLLAEAERVLAIARAKQSFDHLHEVEDRLADASGELRLLLTRALEEAGKARQQVSSSVQPPG